MLFAIVLEDLSDSQKHFFQMSKRAGFVLITAILLYKLINKYYKKLKQSEEEYRAMFDSNPNPMWIFDPKSLDFIKVNKAAITKYGYSEPEFYKMKITAIRPPEEQKRLKDYLSQDKLKENSGIWIHSLRNGKSIQVDIYSNEIIYNNRRARLVLVLDVTEKASYENQLAEQQATLAATNAQLEIIIKELKKSKEKIFSTQKIARIAGWIYIIEKDIFKFSSFFYELLEIQEVNNRLTTLQDVEKFIFE